MWDTIESTAVAMPEVKSAEAAAGVAPYEFRGSVCLCLDLKNPLSYLALKPAFALADELGIVLECLPFAAAALKAPMAARPDDERGTRHRRLRAEYLARDIARYAAVQSLVIRGIYRSPDTSAFAAGLHWLDARRPDRVRDYLLTVFDGYWREAFDVEAPGAIGRVLRQLGEDDEAFASYAGDEAPAATANLRQKLVAAGVFNVPSFVVQGQVFLGRAHLPMVRWLLTGRRGPPPV